MNFDIDLNLKPLILLKLKELESVKNHGEIKY